MALSTSYFLGYVSNGVVHADPPEVAMATTEAYAYLDVFAQVLSYIESSYVDEVDPQALVYGAIDGMIDTLDQHSNFLTPEERESMRSDTRGEYQGIGIRIDIVDDEPFVVRVEEGGPAQAGGVLAGDVLIEIDGADTWGMSIQDVVDVIRGQVGDPIDLLVRRATETSETETIPFHLFRDTIHTVAVRYEMLQPGIGLISVSQFQAGVSTEVVAAIDDLEVDNDGELTGLILDLRNNPGGLLREGIGLSDVFLDEGVIVSTQGRRADQTEVHESYNGSTRYSGPLVVLINGGTASASEVVAGALQDRDRATLLGTTSYGKATVQSIIDFEDGSGLKLTVARYYTPLERSIHDNGIDPNVEVTGGNDFELPEDAPYPEVTDRQLRSALQELNL